ncbi:hypothetical protein RRG08_019935, partial [Elysia crispata]
MDCTLDDPGLENGDVQDPLPESPITFASMGLPANSALQDTAIGKLGLTVMRKVGSLGGASVRFDGDGEGSFRCPRPLVKLTHSDNATCFFVKQSDTTFNERVFFVILTFLSILSAFGVSIYRVATVSRGNPDFTFGLVILLQAGFCFIYIVDGILRERPSEIFILCLATMIIVFYLVMNYIEGTQNTPKLARMIVACCLAPFLVSLGLYIAWDYHVSKKIIFRTVGADATWQGMLTRLLAFQDVLKFDLQLGVRFNGYPDPCFWAVCDRQGRLSSRPPLISPMTGFNGYPDPCFWTVCDRQGRLSSRPPLISPMTGFNGYPDPCFWAVCDRQGRLSSRPPLISPVTGFNGYPDPCFWTVCDRQGRLSSRPPLISPMTGFNGYPDPCFWTVCDRTSLVPPLPSSLPFNGYPDPCFWAVCDRQGRLSSRAPLISPMTGFNGYPDPCFWAVCDRQGRLSSRPPLISPMTGFNGYPDPCFWAVCDRQGRLSSRPPLISPMTGFNGYPDPCFWTVCDRQDVFSSRPPLISPVTGFNGYPDPCFWTVCDRQGRLSSRPPLISPMTGFNGYPDPCFWTGSMVILILVSGLSVTVRDVVVLAVGGPVTIAWFLLGLYAMPAESKPWALVFALLSPCEPAYIAYRFYRLDTYIDEKPGLASAVTICGAAALVVRVIVMVLFTIVYRAFGKGLKEQALIARVIVMVLFDIVYMRTFGKGLKEQ